jgi:predicted outer membrane lipoprotein
MAISVFWAAFSVLNALTLSIKSVIKKKKRKEIS